MAESPESQHPIEKRYLGRIAEKAKVWSTLRGETEQFCACSGGEMRIVIGCFVFLCITSAHAQEYFDHNNSVVELRADGDERQFVYTQPRAGLPVTPGTVLFTGTRSGKNYTGTAYVFTKECGGTEYSVSGAANPDDSTVTLHGQAPILDARCNVTGTKDDVLIFSFRADGCAGPDEPEFSMEYSENAQEGEGTSCPYLYAWNEELSAWQKYGKVIHRAQGRRREMTQAVKLTTFATKFRLAEEEPEDSFIDQVQLNVRLKNGSVLALKPSTSELADRDGRRLHIIEFQSAEFGFELPKEVTASDVETASISVTGYYEPREPARVCKRPNAISYLIVGDARH
ncbi:MAG TPA: hypothetical protein VKT73_16675 [Xanthobacteraceae bacterium]|nr:hypothetical protein [Xanthobacteraceae bacterium]